MPRLQFNGFDKQERDLKIVNTVF